jgi:predicted dehydrogenase
VRGRRGFRWQLGTETLTVSRRRNEGGKPGQEIETFAGPDDSWWLEWQEFVNAISEGRQPLASGQDGLETMKLIGALYESVRTGQMVKLPDNGN